MSKSGYSTGFGLNLRNRDRDSGTVTCEEGLAPPQRPETAAASTPTSLSTSAAAGLTRRRRGGKVRRRRGGGSDGA
ncbi:hypothetical protein LINPERPRIM_LOCUS25320, partial [Linum perenne]